MAQWRPPSDNLRRTCAQRRQGVQPASATDIEERKSRERFDAQHLQQMLAAGVHALFGEVLGDEVRPVAAKAEAQRLVDALHCDFLLRCAGSHGRGHARRIRHSLHECPLGAS